MLQWMGGSRRKVTTSRKSIQNRQKQYFEQRKRQQQTTGSENNANERSKHPHEHRSLDILSLSNLAAVDQEYGSVHTKIARENSEATDPQEKHHTLRCLPEASINKITPEDSSDLNVEKVKTSCYQAETIYARKVSANACLDNEPSTPKYIKENKLNEWKTSSRSQLSVLDVLGDDEFPPCSEQRSAHEAHVAFSVEGLGIMGMETPIHSPRPSNRIFFNRCYTTPDAARRIHTSKKTSQVRDDYGAELDGIINGIGQSLGNSTSVLPFNPRIVMDQDDVGNSRSTELTLERCIPLDALNRTVEDFLNEEMDFCSNLERNEQKWNDFYFDRSCNSKLHESMFVLCLPARSSFLGDGLFDEKKYGVTWKNRSLQVDGDSDNFLRAKNYDISDYGLEDSCLLSERDAVKAWNELNISESSPQYFKHLASEKDYDFSLQEERHPVVDGSGNFGSIFHQTVWSSLATKDTGDDVSLLSEESCSSSAVRGKQTKKSGLSFLKKPKRSKNSHDDELWKSLGDNVKNLFAEEMVHLNSQGLHQEKNLKGAEHHRSTANLLKSRNSHYMKELSKVQRISKPKQRLLFEEQSTSVSMDSDLSPLHGTCRDMDATCLKYMFQEPPSDWFLVPKLYTDTGPPCKRSKPEKPVDQTPYRRFSSEKDVKKQLVDPVSHGSDLFSSIGTKLWNPNMQPAPEVEPGAEPPYSSSVSDIQKDNEIPDLSRQHSLKDGDELKSQSADCRQDHEESQNEVSVENSDSPICNCKPVDVADFKDSCSECEAVEDRTPDPNESPKTISFPEPADEPSSATEENPRKFENCINDKKYNTDSGKMVQYQNVDKDAGMESFVSERVNIGNEGLCAGNKSYQVMLESYVLQLLCVQKVRKEASRLDAVKKA